MVDGSKVPVAVVFKSRGNGYDDQALESVPRQDDSLASEASGRASEWIMERRRFEDGAFWTSSTLDIPKDQSVTTPLVRQSVKPQLLSL